MGVCSMGPGLRFVGGWKHWVRNAESTPLVSGCQVQSHEVGAGLSLLGTRGAVVRHLETLTISGAGSLGECCTLGTHGQVWRNSGLGPGGGGLTRGPVVGAAPRKLPAFPHTSHSGHATGCALRHVPSPRKARTEGTSPPRGTPTSWPHSPLESMMQ